MKKLFLLPAFLFIYGLAIGQITIDSSNVVCENNTINLTEASNGAISLSAAAMAGANMTWDFSALDSVGASSMDFENVTSGIGYTEFPNASFVVNDTGIDTISDYFLKTETNFSAIGEAGLVNGDTIFLPLDQILLSFPSTFHSSFINSYTDTILYTGYRLIMNISQTSTIDGWGTVKMPEGTFPALRQNMKETLREIIQSDIGGGNWVDISTDTTVSNVYQWWTNDQNVKWPLVEIDYDSMNNNIEGISYINVSPQPTGIQSLTSGKITVSPNPAMDFVDFTLDEDGVYQVVVSSITGRKYSEQEFAGTQYRLNISELPPGLYLYQLTNKVSGKTIAGKFVKK